MLELGIGARVQHPSFGEGIVVSMDTSILKVFFRSIGDKEISRQFEGLEVIEPAKEAYQGLSLEDVEKSLKKVLAEHADMQHLVDLGDKWKGGKMLLQPNDHNLQIKEIPIETFFHKIVMLRDRLRVLEQNINSHKVLTDEEKVHLQQYISRAYGSLTTFNVLFKNKVDHFKGAGK
ncbi:MAG: hypothetical protein JXQ87_00050 [Bacteroidia bacterium]